MIAQEHAGMAALTDPYHHSRNGSVRAFQGRSWGTACMVMFDTSLRVGMWSDLSLTLDQAISTSLPAAQAAAQHYKHSQGVRQCGATGVQWLLRALSQLRAMLVCVHT